MWIVQHIAQSIGSWKTSYEWLRFPR